MTDAADRIIPEIVKVREALWRLPNSRASVMIGSGFSRQAQAIALGSRPFPTWNELAQLMRAELNDDSPPVTNIPGLAQAFQDRFGHAALDAFIIRSVPDEGYVPGENHRRLLALPWADIFTTNYDTLLERAALDTFNRRYEVVLSPADLPQRTMPRIVKLHGSFPGSRPFVITTKEYDDYHRSHAPFVNLARQAAMETVFLLLGFSGDDPNFLAWTQWVQKELGPYAPQIYLCNVLDLTSARRADLQSRRVTPIDLGPLFPKEQLPQSDARRITAMTWLLETLARGKPGRPTEWAPWERTKPEPLTPPGPPEVGYTGGFERWPQGQGRVSPDKLRELGTHWKRQRLEYPGYVVAPSDLRNRIWHHTHLWRNALFETVSSLALIEQLDLIREFVWRFDLCLMSLSTDEAHLIGDLLEQVNPFPGTLELPSAQATVPDDPERAELWIELAFSVLRTAREDFEEERYFLWRGRLDSLVKVWPSVGVRLDAETAFWALAQLDLAKLEKHLTDWRRREKTPWGSAQLAALLAEFGHIEPAQQLAAETLQEIRRHLRAAEPRYDLLSLESWLLQLLELLRERPGWRKEEVRDRMTDLQRLGCDPDELRERLQTALESIEPPLTAAERGQLTFDPGERTVTMSMHGGGADAEKLIPAFAVLRLSEVAPVALRTTEMTYLSHEAARAAIWLETVAPMWALTFIVRTNDDDAIKRFMDRAMVATMPPGQVVWVWRLLLRPAEVALSHVENHSPDKKRDMIFGMADASLKLLSRLAFRLDATQRLQLLNLLVRWLHSNGAAKSWAFQEPVEELTRRLLFALEPAELTAAALRLLEVPIIHENGFGMINHTRWVEPIDEFARREDWLAEVVVVPETLVERLAYLLRHGDLVATQRAMRRLLFLTRRSWLSKPQHLRLQEALWSRLDATGLPLHLNHLVPFAWRDLPAPNPVLVDDHIRNLLVRPKWEALKAQDGKSFHTNAVSSLKSHCNEIRGLCSPLFPRPPHISLTAQDAAALLDAMTEWWAENGSALSTMATTEQWRPFVSNDSARWLAAKIVAIIGDVVLPLFPAEKDLILRSGQLLEQIATAGFSVARGAVGLLLAQVYTPAQARLQIADAIVGQNAGDLDAGGWLLLSWMRCHQRGLLTASAPSELTELIATRASVSTDLVREQTCDWLSAIVREYGAGLSDATRRLLTTALAVLLEQTDLKRWLTRYRRGMSKREDGPMLTDLRASAAALAGALYVDYQKRGVSMPEVVELWRTTAEQDTLPEVRRAWLEEMKAHHV